MTVEKYLNQCEKYLGTMEGTPDHKNIVKAYNTIKPLPRNYKLQNGDAWCAGFVSAMYWVASGGKSGFPYECSVSKMVEKAKSLKMWVEDDSVKPKKGWLVIYDWQDSGKGDNTGNPDHVGVVRHVTAKKFQVIEGNYSNRVKTRTMSINGKNIRGFIALKYTDSDAKHTKKDNETIAREVINGLWGNGSTRVKRLTDAGYDAKAIQKIVNAFLSS